MVDVLTSIHVCQHGLAFSNLVLFFSVVFSESMCNFTFGSSSSLSNNFAMLLIHSAFLLCSIRCHILLQNCSPSLESDCLYVFVPSPPTWWEHFFDFWNVLFFFLYCFTLSWYIFNLLFWPVLSSLFSRVVLSFFSLFVFFSFLPNIFQHCSFVYYFCLL